MDVFSKWGYYFTDVSVYCLPTVLMCHWPVAAEAVAGIVGAGTAGGAEAAGTGCAAVEPDGLVAVGGTRPLSPRSPRPASHMLRCLLAKAKHTHDLHLWQIVASGLCLELKSRFDSFTSGHLQPWCRSLPRGTPCPTAGWWWAPRRPTRTGSTGPGTRRCGARRLQTSGAAPGLRVHTGTCHNEAWSGIVIVLT